MKGVVTGTEVGDDGQTWFAWVVIQKGECWMFRAGELKGTGIILSDEDLYGGRGYKWLGQVRVDPQTGEGHIIAGDSRKLKHGPVPLNIDLDKL
jgi:hypothetical protein